MRWAEFSTMMSILDTFEEVSKVKTAMTDAARDVSNLVKNVADKASSEPIEYRKINGLSNIIKYIEYLNG